MTQTFNSSSFLLLPLLVLEEKNCSDLRGPVNGYRKITGGPGLLDAHHVKISTVVSFFCNGSYVLSGNEKRTCQQDGEWSGKQPICIKGNSGMFLDSVDVHRVGVILWQLLCPLLSPWNNIFLQAYLQIICNSHLGEYPFKFLPLFFFLGPKKTPLSSFLR